MGSMKSLLILPAFFLKSSSIHNLTEYVRRIPSRCTIIKTENMENRMVIKEEDSVREPSRIKFIYRYVVL